MDDVITLVGGQIIPEEELSQLLESVLGRICLSIIRPGPPYANPMLKQASRRHRPHSGTVHSGTVHSSTAAQQHSGTVHSGTVHSNTAAQCTAAPCTAAQHSGTREDLHVHGVVALPIRANHHSLRAPLG